MGQLETIDAVIDRLGGPHGIAAKLGLGHTAIGNWLARGRIPPLHYLAINSALLEAGAGRAAPEIFGFRFPDTYGRQTAKP